MKIVSAAKTNKEHATTCSLMDEMICFYAYFTSSNVIRIVY